MSEKRPEELSVEELRQLLYQKKRVERRQRLRRLKEEGRVIEVAGLPPPNPDPPPLAPAALAPSGALRHYELTTAEEEQEAAADETAGVEPTAENGRRLTLPNLRWRWIGDRLLLAAEVAAVSGLIVLALLAWGRNQELNRELAQAQLAQVGLGQPTVAPTPVIGVVVLPSGHRPPVDGVAAPEEAGFIPEHLLPLINAYVPPAIPTPGPEQARRLQIPALSVDKPIVQGDDWEQLKKGVGQHVGTGLPGRPGNLVLSAHNDIYGEIFRHLDDLEPGDEIIITTERQSYTYVVREIEVVEPTAVWVMQPTAHASATLISCYPYLVNNKRIVVFADLADVDLSARPAAQGG